MTDERDEFETEMIFRTWPKKEGGGVIAIMPGVIANNSPYHCQSYKHIGQHSACDPWGLIQRTKLATSSEAGPLINELEHIGYRVKPIYRMQQRHLREREAELARLDAIFKEASNG